MARAADRLGALMRDCILYHSTLVRNLTNSHACGRALEPLHIPQPSVVIQLRRCFGPLGMGAMSILNLSPGLPAISLARSINPSSSFSISSTNAPGLI